MFPTEGLIEKLKNASKLVSEAGEEKSIVKLHEALDCTINSLLEYYEWKKKPFADSFRKDLPKEFLEKK